jgi:hypothetical protein
MGYRSEVEEKTEFKFSELSERAKESARDGYRYSGNYPCDDWWEFIYDDAVRIAALLGITINTTAHKTTKGRSYEKPDIWFSGFGNQGDGASFAGQYEFRADALEQITQETKDETLIRIAHDLTMIGLTRRLQSLGGFSISITTSGRYSHSHTMDISLNMDDDSTEDIEPDLVGLEVDLLQLMRDFADWIYDQLEKENEYLMSDEVVDQALNDDLFDVDGCMI